MHDLCVEDFYNGRAEGWVKTFSLRGMARRQYDAADPKNRLVTGELESRWNAALARVAELEEQLEVACQSQRTVTQGKREKPFSGPGRFLDVAAPPSCATG
jgi:hypothetical protein